MNELNYYILFNPELKNLNINTIKKLYNNDLKLNNEFIKKNDVENIKVISFETFFLKYPDFKLINISSLIEWYNMNKNIKNKYKFNSSSSNNTINFTTNNND